jgi:FkbM family methyltransferase
MRTDTLPNKYFLDLKELEAILDRKLAERSRDRILSELSIGCWIYGAGGYGRRIAKEIAKLGFSVHGFIDRRAQSVKTVDGLPIIDPKNFIRDKAERSTFVLGVMSAVTLDDVRDFASSFPFRHYVFPADLADAFGEAANNFWLSSREKLKRDMPEYPSVFQLLADETSAGLVLDLLRYRINGNFFDDPAYIADDQYLPPDLSGFPAEISFVDGGAFDGDTFRHLLKKGVNFRHWIAFEPDERNFAALSRAPRPEDCIATLFPCGLSDSQQMRRFTNDGTTSSKIDSNASGDITMIQCVKLDDVVQGQEIDYIKLDIEGTELSALEGMGKTIARWRPRLAISAYHKPDDLIRITKALAQFETGHNVYLRQHCPKAFETVAYLWPGNS